jgi:hypothetical protein
MYVCRIVSVADCAKHKERWGPHVYTSQLRFKDEQHCIVMESC